MSKKVGTVALTTTGAVKIVGENPFRKRLHLKALSATGAVVGLDETVELNTTPSNGYFLVQSEHLLLEDYKGEVWAIQPTATVVYLSYWEEDDPNAGCR